MGLTGYLAPGPDVDWNVRSGHLAPDYESILKRSDLHASARVRNTLNPLYGLSSTT